MLRPLHSNICLLAGACLALAGGEDPPGLMPMPLESAGATEITRALMALQRGESGPLEALPASAFATPIAIADEADPDLQRSWTTALPRELQRLDAAARERALAVLDRRFRAAAPAAADERERCRLAAAFVPAPAAVAMLNAAADLAFDRGRFEDFLGIALLLDAAHQPPAMSARRSQVAVLLSGRGPEIDAGLALPPPGTPIQSAAQPAGGRPRLAVDWAAIPGWLLACDPWGRIVWQYRVDRTATVVPGAGAALVRDSHGLRALGDDGTVIPLGPLPAGTRVLAVAGGAAWFATGTRAWRLELGTERLQALELGAEPLSAPLVRGRGSLWLTARELLLFDGDRLVARLRHGLPAANGWRLGADRTHPLVIGADGRSWRIEALNEQLAHAGAVDRARLLLQAARWQEALDALAGKPEASSPDGRRACLRAWLGLGVAQVASHADEVLALAQDVQEEIVARQAIGLGSGHGSALAATMRAALVLLAHDHPDLLFAPDLLRGDDAIDLTEAPADWPVALTGAGYASAVDTPQAPLGGLTSAAGLVDDPQPAPFTPDELREQRRNDGATLYRQRRISLVSRIERKEVRCFDRAGALLWWHRWDGLPLLEAPSTTLLCRGDAVLICEGERRLRAIDLASGCLRAELDLGEEAGSLGDAVVFGHARIALLGPIGVNTRLMLDGSRGSAPAEVIDLPTPARWLLGSGDHVLVAMQDGRVLAYPGGAAVAVPAAMAGAPVAPTLLAAGAIIGDRLYPWRRR